MYGHAAALLASCHVCGAVASFRNDETGQPVCRTHYLPEEQTMTYIETLNVPVEDATVEELREALAAALDTYQTCGGHNRAARNEHAAKVAARTLLERGESLEPDRFGHLATWGIL